MDTATYDMLRQFADSWGMVYMLAIFLAVAFMIIRPGARSKAVDAAQIPFKDESDSK